MPHAPSEEFKRLVEEVKSAGEPRKLTVRELLALFHQERRSRRITPWIRNNLSASGLECHPDFESVFIDSSVELAKRTAVRPAKKPDEDAADPPESDRDPIPRLALLPAANRAPTAINRDADLKRAVTLMLMHDFSQLPVMQNEQNVDGMVSWRSIVAAQAAGKVCHTVRDCMIRNPEILAHDATLFDAVRTVMSREVVLVRGPDQRIVGLVTIADIGQQFVDLAEPFLVLEQIENHIRSLLDGKFTMDQLKEALDPADPDREVEAVSDLTFGEYIRFLEKPENWESLKIGIDRSTFTTRLDEVRRIRNDVMHFHPDGISATDKETLRETARFFLAITQFGKPA